MWSSSNCWVNDFCPVRPNRDQLIAVSTCIRTRTEWYYDGSRAKSAYRPFVRSKSWRRQHPTKVALIASQATGCQNGKYRGKLCNQAATIATRAE